MDKIKVINLLRQAHDEIKSLRNQVAFLEPKAHAYDTIAQLSRLSEHREGGYAQIDLTYDIKAYVDALTAERKAEENPQEEGTN